MSDAGLMEERRQFTARIRDLEQRYVTLIAALADFEEILRRSEELTPLADRLEAILRLYREKPR